MAVTFEGSGAVGYITLDKPPANSYDFDFMEEMGAAVDAAAADDTVKVVIVRSASKRRPDVVALNRGPAAASTP